MSLGQAVVRHPAPLLLDEDGRPVAEVGTELAEVPVPTERVACPYADRRAGLPMNRSALRQMAGEWPGVLASLRAFAGPGPVSVRGALSAVLTGTSAVARHHWLAPGEPVPRGLAVTYKTCLGLSQVLAAACLADPEVGGAPLASLGTADAFFAFLDDGGWLLGQVEVCAGPRPMFADVFAALCEGGGPVPGWATEGRRAVGLAAVALLSAPSPDPTDAPGLARLAGPKGPSWTRALWGAPDRRPADVAWWFDPDDPARDELVAFAGAVRGLPPAGVERALWAAVA